MDQKNLLLAIVFSLAILLGFEFFVGGPQRERLAEEQSQQEAAELSTAPTASNAPIPGGAARPGDSLPDTDAALQETMDSRPSGMQTEAALSQAPRVDVETPTLTGSLSLLGGRVDDLVLKDYRETIDPDSPRIRLLHPAASARPYFADFGWTARQEGVSLPQGDSEWRLVEGERLTPESPVVIEWD